MLLSILSILGPAAFGQTGDRGAQPSHILTWRGYRWEISTSRAGGGLVKGSLKNVFVDGSGNLHLKMSKTDGAWSGAQLFSQAEFGFGTYQWILKGRNFYNMDPPIVLGLFSYGPERGIGVDGENEIDTEFSQWNGNAGRINADFTLYPSTGHHKEKTASAWEDNFEVTAPTAATTTVRVNWTPTRVTWTIMAGSVPINRTANVLKTDTYTGEAANIPQVPLPMAMNLWTFKALPTHPWNITIVDFKFVPR
ncbi:MAG: family 16 glycosylhydrolase [Acidobacteriaceae bacterium]